MMNTRPILSALLLICVADPLSAASHVGEQLIECRSIDSEPARLRCYDQLAASLQSGAESRQEYETQQSPEKVAESLPGNSADQGQHIDKFGAEALPQKGEQDIPQSVKAVVSRLRKNPYKKWIVTLDNGQEWQQMDGRRLSLAAGDTVIIEKGLFSSYFLSKPDSGLRIKVRRIR